AEAVSFVLGLLPRGEARVAARPRRVPVVHHPHAAALPDARHLTSLSTLSGRAMHLRQVRKGECREWPDGASAAFPAADGRLGPAERRRQLALRHAEPDPERPDIEFVHGPSHTAGPVHWQGTRWSAPPRTARGQWAGSAVARGAHPAVTRSPRGGRARSACRETSPAGRRRPLSTPPPPPPFPPCLLPPPPLPP